MFMPGFLVRRKLEKNIAWIQAMDHSIMKEGISTLEHLDLEKVRFFIYPKLFQVSIHSNQWQGDTLLDDPLLDDSILDDHYHPNLAKTCIRQIVPKSTHPQIVMGRIPGVAAITFSLLVDAILSSCTI